MPSGQSGGENVVDADERCDVSFKNGCAHPLARGLTRCNGLVHGRGSENTRWVERRQGREARRRQDSEVGSAGVGLVDENAVAFQHRRHALRENRVSARVGMSVDHGVGDLASTFILDPVAVP